MDFNFQALFWYILAADCAFANTVAWFYQDWYREACPSIFKHFPATKAWCGMYLVLTLWLGHALHGQDILPWSLGFKLLFRIKHRVDGIA